MTESAKRPMRSDAVRNRAVILEAARQEITAHGAEVGMDQIAKAGGVAVGTLYRHFPTKTDLVAAVVSSYVVQVADHAESAVDRLADGSPAFDELAGLVRDIVRATATNQAVKAAARVLNADVDDSEDVLRTHRAIQSLVDAARADGAVRNDLSIDDFYLLLSNAPEEQSEAVVDRWVELILFGVAGFSSGAR